MTMAVDLATKAIKHLSRRNFGFVFRAASRKTKERIPQTIEGVADAKPPRWMRSDSPSRVYRIPGEDYLSIQSEMDHELSVEGKDVQSIEIPLAFVDNADRIVLTQDAKDENHTISIDSSYDYPPILWEEVDADTNERVVSLRVEASLRGSLLYTTLSNLFRLRKNKKVAKPAVGTPAVVPSKEQPPIFLISIDALRYDTRDELQPLIDALGSHAFIPSEPRTQGTWTPPAHASMFTGTHPGRHGYVGYGKGEGDKRPINPDLITIPELLTDNGYKCSGLVSHSRILPEFGFGRGFHRFRYDGMAFRDWITRSSDAKESVNQLVSWLEQDIAVRDHSLFYFLHVFDPHYPYIPPIECFESSHVDFSRSKEYMSEIKEMRALHQTYPDKVHQSHDIDVELINDMKEWYSLSVEYTALQIVRLVNYLKSKGLFENSLIIITGDHGEEFGDRGFFTHNSLYDANIRPFMAIKPPAEREWPDKDTIDTIDFLPTIASSIEGATIPEQCAGTPIQHVKDETPRITERIYPDWYSISIEIEGTKGIYTYEYPDYPDRPATSVIKSGPTIEEYYSIPAIRSGCTSEIDVNLQDKEKIREIVYEFISGDSVEYRPDVTSKRPSNETVEQLRDLGYQ